MSLQFAKKISEENFLLPQSNSFVSLNKLWELYSGHWCQVVLKKFIDHVYFIALENFTKCPPSPLEWKKDKWLTRSKWLTALTISLTWLITIKTNREKSCFYYSFFLWKTKCRFFITVFFPFVIQRSSSHLSLLLLFFILWSKKWAYKEPKTNKQAWNNDNLHLMRKV